MHPSGPVSTWQTGVPVTDPCRGDRVGRSRGCRGDGVPRGQDDGLMAPEITYWLTQAHGGPGHASWALALVLDQTPRPVLAEVDDVLSHAGPTRASSRRQADSAPSRGRFSPVERPIQPRRKADSAPSKGRFARDGRVIESLLGQPRRLGDLRARVLEPYAVPANTVARQRLPRFPCCPGRYGPSHRDLR